MRQFAVLLLLLLCAACAPDTQNDQDILNVMTPQEFMDFFQPCVFPKGLPQFYGRDPWNDQDVCRDI